VVGYEPDVTATTTVATVGTTFGNMGLTAKTYTSCATVTGLGVQLCCIYEGRHASILRTLSPLR